jgi:septum formation protein
MRTIFTFDWKNPGRSIILASQSPRRSALLKQMGFSFESLCPDVPDEGKYLDAKAIERSVRDLACAKAKSVSVRHRDALVLGADTVVVCENKILGKPESEARAFDMLRVLSGKSHSVFTGVALVCEESGFAQSGIEETVVFFRDIPDWEIAAYIETKEYFDKAGAYGIQGSALVFVSKIEGCFYNVVGLPVFETISLFNAYMTRKEPDNV